jgi:hypothetical protein
MTIEENASRLPQAFLLEEMASEKSDEDGKKMDIFLQDLGDPT